MPCYAIDGVRPVVHPDAYVHPTAVLIGDVHVGADVYIGPCASLRGDFGTVLVEEGCNVQDTCVLHGARGVETLIERNGHIGHGAVVHSCHLQPNVLVGMNAVVMDRAVIGESCIIAASAFVKAYAQMPARSLITGVPGRVARQLTDEELAGKAAGTELYQELARRSLRSMVEVPPLAEPEPGRPRLPWASADPL